MNENEDWWILLDADFGRLNRSIQRRIYNNFYTFAYREIAMLIKDRTMTEDIIQEAFLKIINNRHKVNHDGSIKQWSRKIIRNHLIDTLRKKRGREISIEIVYKEISEIIADTEAAATVEKTVENSQRNQLLHESIHRLKPEYKELILKFYIEEKSYKQISFELGVSEQVIAKRLSRARKMLSNLFLKKWGDEEK
ncbi:sigma-70 family RNA polymerase sigma factor [Saccharibacillus sp. CPCC 101409]|uniref:RNA polymerase sigma factor n=1 Tax=Saccharibacillus sp. CPCC 101409 TaxID=3058041 RepID=UPI002671BFD4|nr:sigma-70 family RNA polymerase sigma factor [Saccharibacillus sp. CPCC 101409]MDO3410370.1 sigma-70 family RNA polymerase sigma factor [Saccharibacillus sp. CPCC 101409]